MMSEEGRRDGGRHEGSEWREKGREGGGGVRE